MTEPIIQLKQLHIAAEKPLVKSVDLIVPKGSVVGVVGESGSGKTLTMKSLMHLLPSHLQVSYEQFLFNGETVSMDDALPISMIFQDPMTSLNPLRTVGFHLTEVVQRYQKVAKQEAIRLSIEMLETVGIQNARARMDQYPFELSGGMRQRVMIAMALLSKPEVLIADEPTTALDVTIQLQILALLAKLQKEMGLTVIIVSHDLGVIAGLCDYVNVMYQGQVVELGTVVDIFEHAQHTYTKKLLALAQFDLTYDEVVGIGEKTVLKRISPTHMLRVEEA